MQQSKKQHLPSAGDPLFSYNADLLIIGLSLLAAGIYFNGIAAVCHSAVCIGTAVLCEYIGFKLVVKKNTLPDLSAAATGLLIALSLPACAPLWLGAAASLFAIAVAKLPFGSARGVPFVPSAAGMAFVQLCYTDLSSTYAASSGAMNPVWSTSEQFVRGSSLIDLLESGKAVSANIFGFTSILSGSYPGAMGATSMLAMLGVMLYILIRRKSALASSFGFIAACAAFAFIFPRINSSRMISVVMELSAGTLMLVALLVLNDPVTSPKKGGSAFLYGMVAGLFCMLLRRFGKIDDPSFFAVLIVNALYRVVLGGAVSKRLSGEKKQRMSLAAKKDRVAAKAARRQKNNGSSRENESGGIKA